MAVAHSIRLLENGQQLPLKIVSSHIWGTSKVLDRYKKDIADATGMTLAELNLVVMPETRLKLLDNLGWQKRRYPTR